MHSILPYGKLAVAVPIIIAAQSSGENSKCLTKAFPLFLESIEGAPSFTPECMYKYIVYIYKYIY